MTFPVEGPHTMQIIPSRAARSLFLVPLALVATIASMNCGSNNVVVDGDAGDVDGGGLLDGTASADGPLFEGGACGSLGQACTSASSCCVNECTRGACGGPASGVDGGGTTGHACNTDGGPCAKGFDCCSGTCNGGKCVGSTLSGGDGGGGVGGQCLPPTTTCTQSAQCC